MRSEINVNDGVLYMPGRAFEAPAAAPVPTAAAPAAPPAKTVPDNERRRAILQDARQAESERAAKKQ